MTIRLPKPNYADKFLRLIGKKRAVYLPKNMGQYGFHFQVVGIKESFWEALIRKRNIPLPEGFINVFSVEDLKE